MNIVGFVCACVCLYTENGATYNSSICSDKGPTLETPALKLFTEANLCYQLSYTTYNTLPPAQHHSFFNFKLNPFIYNQLKCISAKKMQFNWKSQSCCFDAFLFLSREPCAVNTKSHHWFGQHAHQHINNFWWGMNEVIILLWCPFWHMFL